MSPIAAKLRRPAAPTMPTKAGPVLMAMWKRGMASGRSVPSDLDRVTQPDGDACRPPGMVWLLAERVEDDEQSVAGEVLDEPVLGCDDRHGGRPDRVEHLDHLRRCVALAVRGESREIREEDSHLALRAAAEARLRRIGPRALGELPWQIRPEELVDATQLRSGPLEECELLGRRPVDAETIEDAVDRSALRLRRSEVGEGLGVPSMQPLEGAGQVEAAERAGQRAFTPILDARPECDRAEGERHQQMPLPPREMPVSAEGDRHHRLREEDESDDDGEQERAATPGEEAQEVPRRERVQRERQDGGEPERWRDLVRRGLRRQRRDSEDRSGGPPDEGHQQRAAQERRVTEHDLAAGPAKRQR